MKILFLSYYTFSVFYCLTYKKDVTFPNGTQTILTCPACKAGQKLDVECNLNQGTVCTNCSKEQYMSTDNYAPNCRSCSKCKSPKVEISPCTPTSNRKCGCRNGYYEKNNNCLKCSPCYLGEGVEKNCSSNLNTECKVCLNNTFSDVISSEEPCKSYQTCTEGFTVLNLELSWYDKFCLNCTTFNADVDLNKFTKDFISYNYYTADQLKKLVRIAFDRTRNDVEYMSRSNLETMFKYDNELPNYMGWTDLAGTATLLMNYYNVIQEACLINSLAPNTSLLTYNP
ncbi:tumor necrosis factor receptor [Lymphocystis disease virus 3]|uniref:Tumor necrosis factor receptor n=1 Tax=Lymphocystis disease virus 3 TaxID=2560566 RepID=A0A1B2RVV8_9VIRU|nr:tumor necrosis factor receptor [Lymphocystis disease virus Sa]AOC55126.1 tumor necrosis factor receptor [Lymphocystis disease virus 3]